MRSRDLLFRTDLLMYNSKRKTVAENNIKKIEKNVWCSLSQALTKIMLGGVIIPEVFDTLTHFEPTF